MDLFGPGITGTQPQIPYFGDEARYDRFRTDADRTGA
jgi:hypothetical protein